MAYTQRRFCVSGSLGGLDEIFEPEPTERCLAHAGRLMTFCHARFVYAPDIIANTSS
jgi:hypothetical protein